MGRRKNHSIPDELLSQLWEMTAYFWQVGAVVSGLFAALCVYSFFEVHAFGSNFSGKPMEIFLEKISWLMFLIPIICLFLSVLFGKRAYASYREQNGA